MALSGVNHSKENMFLRDIMDDNDSDDDESNDLREQQVDAEKRDYDTYTPITSPPSDDDDDSSSDESDDDKPMPQYGGCGNTPMVANYRSAPRKVGGGGAPPPRPVQHFRSTPIVKGGSASEAGQVVAFLITAVIIVAVIFLIYYCWKCYSDKKTSSCHSDVIVEEYIYAPIMQPSAAPTGSHHYVQPHSVSTHGARKNHHISKNKNFRSVGFSDTRA